LVLRSSLGQVTSISSIGVSPQKPPETPIEPNSLNILALAVGSNGRLGFVPDAVGEIVNLLPNPEQQSEKFEFLRAEYLATRQMFCEG
jgi:hypothetical protein